jgi:hypothetical protein
MHHIVQEGLFHEFGFNVLVDALKTHGCAHTIVKVTPFVDELDLELDGDVMIWGSMTLGRIAEKKGWTPGQFMNENFDMRILHEKYGSHMLNDDAQFCTFGEMAFEGKRFIRPVHDSKTFCGMVMDGPDLRWWKHQVLPLEGTCTLSVDTPVMHAGLKDIELEARFFVVNGVVVTGSSYRSLGRQIMYQRVEHNNPLMRPMLDFAQAMVDIWSPSPAFVLDIAQVGGEYKVVEINCINHAGFYASDMRAVVKAIENM